MKGSYIDISNLRLLQRLVCVQNLYDLFTFSFQLGFAETLYGRKRWFLTPPDVKPDFHPNKTTLQWFVQDYPKQKNDFQFHECTLRPGEVMISSL